MNDATTEHDDELVSAYLDGEATPDEVALVESSPELLTRLTGFKSVSNAVGNAPKHPQVPSPQTLIGKAIDEGTPTSRTRVAGPTDLGERQRRRSRRNRILATAAAVVLVGTIVSIRVVSLGSDETTTDSLESAGPVVETSEVVETADEFDDAAGAANQEGASRPEPPFPILLGSFESLADARLGFEESQRVEAAEAYGLEPRADVETQSGEDLRLIPEEELLTLEACDNANRVENPDLTGLVGISVFDIAGEQFAAYSYTIGNGSLDLNTTIVTSLPKCSFAASWDG